MAFTKSIVRISVIGGLAAGALVVVAGPHRVGAMMNQVRHTVSERIDNAIDDPIALRAQLRDLQREYPQRIAEISAELDTLDDQIVSLEKNKRVAGRALEMAKGDLVEWNDMLTRAKEARNESPFRMVSIRYDDRTYSYDQALTRVTSVRSAADLYGKEIEAIDRDLVFLQQQEDRLHELLVQLESEQDQLFAQIAQLDAEIEMIERNEKLITMIEDREDAIRDYSTTARGVSLEQVTNRLAKIRAEQEARFDAIMGRSDSRSYKDMAEAELSLEDAHQDIFGEEIEPRETSSTVITPDGETETAGGVAMTNGRVIID